MSKIPTLRGAAIPPPYRFTLETRQHQDFAFETPASGGTELVAASNAEGHLDLLSIGSEGYLHLFRRDLETSGGWQEERLPFRAVAVTAVTQRSGIDKVFFVDIEDKPKLITVYELTWDTHSGVVDRQPIGRLATTDENVYGVTGLSGLQDRHGANVLVTTLAAHPATEESSCVAVFGRGLGTGVLSLEGDKPLAASRAAICGAEPGQLEWPHPLLVTLFDGKLAIDRGVRKGALLQCEPLPVPPLADVAAFDLVRDCEGGEQILALDAAHRLFRLAQVDSGEDCPAKPQWSAEWEELPTLQPNGSRPPLIDLTAVRRDNGEIEIFARDAQDQVWHLAERPALDGGKRWSPLLDLGIRAAHLAAKPNAAGETELFAVNRQDQILWLRQVERSSWLQRKIAWRGASSDRLQDIYRACLTVRDGQASVPRMPVRVSSSERLPLTINGLTYAVGPDQTAEVRTNAFGKLNVSFEWTASSEVPTLQFEAEFLRDGILAVCPARQVQLYVRHKRDPLLDSTDTTFPKIYLIPEGTEVRQP